MDASNISQGGHVTFVIIVLLKTVLSRLDVLTSIHLDDMTIDTRYIELRAGLSVAMSILCRSCASISLQATTSSSDSHHAGWHTFSRIVITLALNQVRVYDLGRSFLLYQLAYYL